MLGNCIIDLLAEVCVLFFCLKVFLQHLLILSFTQINICFQFLIFLIKFKDFSRELEHIFVQRIDGRIFFLDKLHKFFELLNHLIFCLNQAIDLHVQIYNFFSVLIELFLNTCHSDKALADVFEGLFVAHFFNKVFYFNYNCSWYVKEFTNFTCDSFMIFSGLAWKYCLLNTILNTWFLAFKHSVCLLRLFAVKKSVQYHFFVYFTLLCFIFTFSSFHSETQRNQSVKTASLHSLLPSFPPSLPHLLLPSSHSYLLSSTKNYDSPCKCNCLYTWVLEQNSHNIFSCNEISGTNTLCTFGSCGLTRYVKRCVRDFSISCIGTMGCNKGLLLSIRNKVWGIEFSCRSIRWRL